MSLTFLSGRLVFSVGVPGHVSTGSCVTTPEKIDVYAIQVASRLIGHATLDARSSRHGVSRHMSRRATRHSCRRRRDSRDRASGRRAVAATGRRPTATHVVSGCHGRSSIDDRPAERNSLAADVDVGPCSKMTSTDANASRSRAVSGGIDAIEATHAVSPREIFPTARRGSFEVRGQLNMAVTAVAFPATGHRSRPRDHGPSPHPLAGLIEAHQ